MVGRPESDLIEKFSAGRIPLGSNFKQLIQMANFARKALGFAPNDDKTVKGIGAGLQLSEDASAPLSVKCDETTLSTEGGTLKALVSTELTAGNGAIAVQPGPGIKTATGTVDVDYGGGLVIGRNGKTLEMDEQFRFKKGMIMMFSGTKDEVPRGWALCDGSNKLAPDLRERFILGVSLDRINGKNDVNFSDRKIKIKSDGENKDFNINFGGTTVTIDPSELEERHLPKHRHSTGLIFRDYMKPEGGREGYGKSHATLSHDGVIRQDFPMTDSFPEDFAKLFGGGGVSANAKAGYDGDLGIVPKIESVNTFFHNNIVPWTEFAGSGAGHGHTGRVSGNATGSVEIPAIDVDIEVPYYALAFIMFVGVE